uniref:Uncharacterized protein n=1 Tax=Populus trichocarpa TaxID=3694 RepID=A0A2K1R8I8_POPTR
MHHAEKILHQCFLCHFLIVNATEFSLLRDLVSCPELPLVSFQHPLPNCQVLHCFVPTLDPLVLSSVYSRVPLWKLYLHVLSFQSCLLRRFLLLHVKKSSLPLLRVLQPEILFVPFQYLLPYFRS